MNIITLYTYFFVEKVHRHVFDTFYTQDYNITKNDKYYLQYYRLLCKLFPNFRWRLKNNYVSLHKKKDKVALTKKEQQRYDLLISHNAIRYTEKYD